MVENGGKREGAGRPAKRDKHAGVITRAEKRIADRLPELIDNMFILAQGVPVEETDSDGNTTVYRRPPDRQANEYLINRILGKPTERQETTGKDGGPLIIKVLYADLDAYPSETT